MLRNNIQDLEVKIYQFDDVDRSEHIKNGFL